jgi:uncharacterized protein (UPF0332 family)
MVKGLNDLEECMKKGLIRKTAPSVEGASKSIARARVWSGQAKEAYDAELYDVSILGSYEAMFHAAKSLLIKDGYREKSHYCVARYLEFAYFKKGLLSKELVTMLDSYREIRHQTAYDTEFEATSEEAKGATKDAEVFIREIAKLL